MYQWITYWTCPRGAERRFVMEVEVAYCNCSGSRTGDVSGMAMGNADRIFAAL